MRIQAQQFSRGAARLDRQLCPDPVLDRIGVTRHESGEIRGFLAPSLEQVLQHFGEEGAARPHRVRQRPLARLRDSGGAAARVDVGRVEAERVDAAATRLAAVRVLAPRRAKDAGDERRDLHGREQFQRRIRLLEEHGAVADEERAVRPGGIAGVRVKIDWLTGKRRVQVWVCDLACHRRRIEGKRVGGREVDRRRVQPVIGEDVQPDDGLPQHVRRDPQDRMQQQGLNGEELGAKSGELIGTPAFPAGSCARMAGVRVLWSSIHGPR